MLAGGEFTGSLRFVVTVCSLSVFVDSAVEVGGEAAAVEGVSSWSALGFSTFIVDLGMGLGLGLGLGIGVLDCCLLSGGFALSSGESKLVSVCLAGGP